MDRTYELFDAAAVDLTDLDEELRRLGLMYDDETPVVECELAT
jgi:hypothetical protein